MAKPPLFPVGNNKDYFDKLIEEINPYFIDKDLKLVFDGYKETIKAYSNLNTNNIENCWELSRDFCMWGEYFSDLKALIEKLFLDVETEKQKEFAIISIKEDSNKVANGDRLANKNPDIISLKRDRNLLQSFLTVLSSKIEYCDKCYNHCKSTYEWEKQLGAGSKLMFT